jgi:hypothetical protein
MRRVFALSAVAAIAAGGFASAQDVVQEVEGQALPKAQAIMIQADSTAIDGEAPVMNFQVMSADSAGGVFFGGGPEGGLALSTMGSDPWSLLSMKDVQADIELVEEQRNQLSTIRQEFNDRIQEQMKSMREGGFESGQGRELAETFRKLQEEQKEAVNKVLLPHQIERLQQVALQSRMKNSGTAGVLADKKLIEDLGITDEQKDRLRTKAEELAKELQKKIEALREETREELLQELTAEQREKLQKLMGVKFEGSLNRSMEMPPRIRQRIERDSEGTTIEKAAEEKTDDK